MPTAKRGAMVESAPTDINAFEPRRAKRTVPATKAKKPVMGGMPARRAVASCSGTAMARSMTPAPRSRVSHERWEPCMDDANQATLRCRTPAAGADGPAGDAPDADGPGADGSDAAGGVGGGGVTT